MSSIEYVQCTVGLALGGHSYYRSHRPAYYHRPSYSLHNNYYYSRSRPFTAFATKKLTPAKPLTSAPAVSELLLDIPNAKVILQSLSQELGSCASPALEYLDTLQSTGSEKLAQTVARRVYVQNFRPGGPLQTEACQAAEKAFRQSAAGENPLLSAALAFVNADASDSACTAAARGYLQALADGDEAEAASLAAFKAFAGQSAKSGAACGNLDASVRTAVGEIVTKSLARGNANGFDSACAEASKAFITTFAEGGSEAEATEAAAVYFLNEVGDSPPGEDSACFQAAQAFLGVYNQ